MFCQRKPKLWGEKDCGKLNISFHFVPVVSSVHIPDLYPRSGLSCHFRLHGNTRVPLLQHVEYLRCHEVPGRQHHLSWLHLRGCQAVRLVDPITYHQVHHLQLEVISWCFSAHAQSFCSDSSHLLWSGMTHLEFTSSGVQGHSDSWP